MKRSLSLLLVLMLALPVAGEDGGVSDTDPPASTPTLVPTAVITKSARLLLPSDSIIDVVGGCWLSENTCVKTARIEEQYSEENKRLRQNVLDAYKDKWALIALISGAVAAIAFGAGYLVATTAKKP